MYIHTFSILLINFNKPSPFNKVKGTYWVEIGNMFKIDFIALNESRRIQLQFVLNRIKITPLESEIQPAKGCATSLR